MSSQVVNPFQNFMGLNAVPIQNGYIYIGEENKDPESYPIAAYWDNGLTIPATQPIRTISGYYSNGGTPGQLFVNGRYSIRVRDNTGTQVFYSASSQFAGSYLPTGGGDMSGAINWAKGTDIPSAALTDIASATGNYVTVTGSATITALGTAQAGAFRLVRFSGSCTVTNNNTSLILPQGNNIQTNAGDILGFVSEGSGNWRLATFLSVAGTPNITTRQSILYGVTNSNGQPAFLSAGTGLALNLSATAKALRVTFAAGLTDYVSTVSTDVANVVSSLAINNTSYISVDYSSPTAMIWNKTLAAPQQGYTYTRSNQSLLHFGGTVGATTVLDDFGNTWTAQGSAKIQSTWSKFGGTALGGGGGSNQLNGTTDYVKTTNITSLNGSGWTIRGFFNLTSLPTAGTTVFLAQGVNAAGFGVAIGINNNAGTVKLAAYVSSNGTSWNILNAALATLTIAINTDYHVRLSYDNNVYTLYQNGSSQLTSFSVNQTSGSFAQFCLGSGNGTAGTFVTGYMDEWEILPYSDPVTTVPTSAADISAQGYASDYFSLADMTMYQVSGASTSAGTNPAFIAKNRVYVGECTTSSSAVTSVTNYPIAALSGGIRTVKRVLVTASGTYTPSSGLAYADVELQAGGGGASNANPATPVATGGAGAGAYTKKRFTAAEIGASVSVTIGSGGGANTAGGTSSFGALLAVTGGAGTTTGTSGGQAVGGVGGTVTTAGDYSIAGQAGTDGWAFSAANVLNGQGGNSALGFGGGGSTGASPSGKSPTGYGSGGSAGRSGQPGICIITEYLNV